MSLSQALNQFAQNLGRYPLTIYEMKEASLGSIVLGVGSGAAMFGDADASHILTGDYDI